MQAGAILEHFLSKASWVDRSTTVDRIILGEAGKEINKILVSWMSTMPAVRYAIDNGFDMLMTHEPTFWIHRNEIESLDCKSECNAKLAAAQDKRKLIEDSGLVVIRNHDVWDRIPDVGIPWALARFLGLNSQPYSIGSDGYLLAYGIDEINMVDLAAKISKLTAGLGDPVVQLFGCKSSKITKLGIGTGCFCYPDLFMDMGCNGAIVCDDGCLYWKDISWALETGLPLIRIGHGTSEEPGMSSLTDYINENLVGISAEHYKLKLGVSYIGNNV